MAVDHISCEMLRAALRTCRFLEDYPNHRPQRLPPDLRSEAGRHAASFGLATSLEVTMIVALYDPTQPKWKAPCDTADYCSFCGDTLFTPETVRKLDEVIAKLPAVAPLYKLA